MSKRKDNSLWKQLFNASQVGLLLVISTFVGFLIGYGLDRLLGTSPYLTFIFLILGIVAGFREVFRFIKKSM